MRHGTHLCPMRVALLAVAMLAGADELTLRSIVRAHGAVSDPINTRYLTAGDVVALRGVVGAIEARAGDP